MIDPCVIDRKQKPDFVKGATRTAETVDRKHRRHDESMAHMETRVAAAEFKLAEAQRELYDAERELVESCIDAIEDTDV